MYKVSNGQEGTPNSDCNTAQQGTEWKCFFMDTLYNHLKGKFMVINSQAIAYDVANLDFEKCIKRKKSTSDNFEKCSMAQVNYVDKYLNQYRQMLEDWASKNNEVSIWSKECTPNIYSKQILYYDSPLEKIPSIIGTSTNEAIQNFVFENKSTIVYEKNCWDTN